MGRIPMAKVPIPIGALISERTIGTIDRLVADSFGYINESPKKSYPNSVKVENLVDTSVGCVPLTNRCVSEYLDGVFDEGIFGGNVSSSTLEATTEEGCVNVEFLLNNEFNSNL